MQHPQHDPPDAFRNPPRPAYSGWNILCFIIGMSSFNLKMVLYSPFNLFTFASYQLQTKWTWMDNNTRLMPHCTHHFHFTEATRLIQSPFDSMDSITSIVVDKLDIDTTQPAASKLLPKYLRRVLSGHCVPTVLYNEFVEIIASSRALLVPIRQRVSPC